MHFLELAEMQFSGDKQYLRIVFSIIQRTIHGADIFGVVEEFPYIQFSDIDTILNSLISEEYLISIDGKLRLTASGEEYLKSINRVLGNRGIYKYILPSSNARIEEYGIDLPYIPRKNKKR